MNSKKKILFIYGPLGGGGAERVLIDVLRNFDYEKYSVDLAVICRGGALMDEVPRQVRVIELWPGYTWDYKLALRLSRWLHSDAMLSRRMNGPRLPRDYDLEISFLEGMPLKLGALRTTQAKKATWVHADLDTHRYEASQFYRGEEIRDYNRMDVVVNVSKDCEAAFRRRFPDCTSELRVIYNPIDRRKIESMSQQQAAAGSDASGKYLTAVTVGRLTAQKNPERLLRLASMAREAGLPVRFKWIGDGELRSQMEALRDRMGLQDIVEFTGFTKNPFPHIKAADMMLVSSDFEGFCLVICEAMCLGVPVISTRTAGPTEIIGDNRYGVLTDISAEAMFDALRRWVEQPSEREMYARRAAARPDDFSVARTMQSIYSLLDESDE